MTQLTDFQEQFLQNGYLVCGVENRHFRHDHNYYRHLSNDLNYQNLYPELVERLKTAGLYADKTESRASLRGAWLPSKTFSMPVRQFK
ncbi:MAG: hypothetical protein KA165_01645 [Saprospiraceae bacterium]|nr:hypothetical protein [Saprospiraceae bacterium]